MDVLYNTPEPVTALILFVLYVIIIAIILLNMLIALVSERFARIHKNRRTQLIEARARAIDDIDSMLSFHRREKLGKEIGKYLHAMIPSHRHSRTVKGSSLQQTQSKANDDMSKTVRRGVRHEFAKSQRRSGYTPPQTPERRLTTQDTLGPRTALETILETRESAAETIRVQAPSSSIMDPESYLSDSDSTDSDYSDRYSTIPIEHLAMVDHKRGNGSG